MAHMAFGWGKNKRIKLLPFHDRRLDNASMHIFFSCTYSIIFLLLLGFSLSMARQRKSRQVRIYVHSWDSILTHMPTRNTFDRHFHHKFTLMYLHRRHDGPQTSKSRLLFFIMKSLMGEISCFFVCQSQEESLMTFFLCFSFIHHWVSYFRHQWNDAGPTFNKRLRGEIKEKQNKKFLDERLGKKKMLMMFCLTEVVFPKALSRTGKFFFV